MTTRCRHFLLQALGDSVADSFRALLGEASMDKFNPDLLREEPTDKVSGNGLPQASTQRAFRWRRLLETHVFYIQCRKLRCSRCTSQSMVAACMQVRAVLKEARVIQGL